jgi:hypothetical protein
MSEAASISNEQDAANAFSKQSVIFDEIYSPNKIIQYKRERVRAVVTDIANGMLNELTKKVTQKGLTNKISVEQCSYTSLNELKDKGPYQFIFSNFAGLNCTDQLEQIMDSFPPLLVPGGIVTMVLLPPFCLWELALALRGNFKAAFRRFNSKHGAQAHIEGQYFKCWYYTPSMVTKYAESKFDVLRVEGLCTIVPPSYFEHFADKHPKTFSWLKKAEERNKSKWPWKNIGDYYIITLRKK